jgi:hypothetical protein
MSYDIYLKDPVTKDVIQFDEPHHMRGGTYCLGGTTEAHLNVTYNYGEHYRRVFGDSEVQLSNFDTVFGGGETGIRKLYGMSGADSIPILKEAISKLGDDVDDDYWKPTEGNAKRALLQLLSLAKMRPDGIWDGD